ncbi:hypothetical protein ABT324_24175 [Saccharopolyspora sp. NPDC000359]|uniref:hypothetical protein n=1 Tax=Saccharopolyspora sp. NPDC000359 TaxID=3154251 RepID=UPI003327D559
MTATRTAPPGLALDTPPCSMCGESTDATPDRTFDCRTCGCSWSIDDPEQHGEWFEPDAPQCPDTIQPRGEIVRCLLHAGHGGKWHYADGYSWTGASA